MEIPHELLTDINDYLYTKCKKCKKQYIPDEKLKNREHCVKCYKFSPDDEYIDENGRHIKMSGRYTTIGYICYNTYKCIAPECKTYFYWKEQNKYCFECQSKYLGECIDCKQWNITNKKFTRCFDCLQKTKTKTKLYECKVCHQKNISNHSFKICFTCNKERKLDSGRPPSKFKQCII